VTEVGNKDREFWKTLEMVLIESWIEEKNWMKVKEKLSKGRCREQEGKTRKKKRWEE